MKMISVARDFTDTPGGRSKGEYTGLVFRENFLMPALREHDQVVVDLSDVVGFGSSFLEEAFGGLVRAGYSLNDLRKRLVVQGGVPLHVQRIWQYINDEAVRLGRR